MNVFKTMMKLLCCVGLLGASLGHALTVQRGPYLQNARPDAMVIRWRTDVASNSQVRYGVTAGNLNLVANVATSVTEHEVTLTGLTPGQRYYYSVGSSTTVHAGGSAEYFFNASPVAGSHDRDYRIWVLGDAGTRYTDQFTVRDAYYALDNVDTDLILMLGDNAYSSGTDSEYTNSVFVPYKDILRNAPVYSTRGNHEQSASVYYNAFSFPKQGEAGGAASGTEAYYSFDFGDVHFVCLDSYGSDMNPGAAQYQWLQQDLQNNTRKWVIAFWHHPPYSITGGHNSDSESGMRLLRENANPILEQFGVDVQLAGHNHSYNRSYYINGHYGTSSSWNPSSHRKAAGDGNATPYDKAQAEGAVYVMSGSAGKLEYGVDTHPANVSSLYELGSFVLDVKADRLTGRLISTNGSTRDEFTILKGSSGGNRSPVSNFTFTSAALTATFTDQSSDVDGTIASRQWQFGDGNSSTATHPSHTYASAGSYTVTLTVTDDDGASHSSQKTVTVSNGGGNELLDGVPVTNLSAAKNVELFYTIEVPANSGSLLVKTSGGSGDADLFVRFGTPPTSSTYDCRSNGGNNAESCNLSNPAAGTWHIMVRAYTAFSGVTLLADYAPAVSDTEPNNSTAQAVIVGAAGSVVNGTMLSNSDRDYFQVALPAGATLTSTLTPNSNSDYDLYVYDGNGSQIGKSENSKGKVDTVTVTNSSGSTATRYIEVRYYSGTTGSSGSYKLNLNW